MKKKNHTINSRNYSEKILELNVQTQGPGLLTFTHLTSLDACEWAIWTEGKYPCTEGPLKRVNETAPLILLLYLIKSFSISGLEFHSCSLKPCRVKKFWILVRLAQYSKPLPILRCLPSLLHESHIPAS